MAAIPELHEPLADGVIELRLAAERDIPEILIAHQDDPDMHGRLGEDRPPTGAELGDFFERAPARRANGDGVALTVLGPGSDICQGGVTVHGLDWHNLRAELGLWVAPQSRGRGWAAHALRLTSTWLFGATAIERITVLTHPDNAPMMKAARSAGFSFEGVLRGYARVRGHRVDNAVLSLLASDR